VATRQAAGADPSGFVAFPELMVIDEIQRAPELLLAIKEEVDTDPRPGRYLLTGSARVLGLRVLPDVLPGRTETIELWPFSQGEMTWSRQRVELSHYRTKDKIEVDAVLEDRQGRVVGIEVKAASTVRAEDFRGLRHLADRLGDDLLAGIVLYTGTQTLPFGPRLQAMPVSSLWEMGRSSFVE
jgi:predicted AAA+ superfamily ATPase